MKKSLMGIRGAFLTGLGWALVWAPIAVLFGLIIDPDGSMDEMWVAIGAYPGFLSGVVFCAILGIADRGRRLDELSLARVAARGAIAGLLVGTFPFTIGEATTALPLPQLAAIVIGSITLLSTASAVATAMLRRSAGRKQTPARAA